MTKPSRRVFHAVKSSVLAIQSHLGQRAAGGSRGERRSTPRSVVARALLVLALALLTFSPSRAHAGWSGGSGCGQCGTLAQGQQLINQGSYQAAIGVFECIIQADPLTVDAHRGRIEAELLLGRYSDAVQSYARVTAIVVPSVPDVGDIILASYDARLAASPWNVPALTGGSFARWWFFEYESALPLLDRLIMVRPYGVYGYLFRGSNRLFAETNVNGGKMDLDLAILLAPFSANVRYIVADAYTYALPKPSRALSEANLALQWGLDTPRVQAIIAGALDSMGDVAGAAIHYKQHIDLVTTQTVTLTGLPAGDEVTLDLVPGRTYSIPVSVVAGQTLSIQSSSPSDEVGDSILVLLGPDGQPVVGNDDLVDYYAGLDWVAPQTGTYTLRITSFEGVGTGQLVVTRD